MDIESKYKRKTDKEHILDNPDTYIGSVENVVNNIYIFKENKIVIEEIEYNPGLFKLFDEGIVNCRDHVIRMENKDGEKVNMIDIEIKDNSIKMTNNGDGIDIEKHKEYNLWVPELIFGHLRTSTNYDKKEDKITGGKNGFGFKLVLIWSTYGMIETVDHYRGLKYVQEFKNNLNIIEKPIITKCKKKPYTTVYFTPDYKRLGLNGLSNSMISLFNRRVYDIAGITSKNITVKLNSNKININDFTKYVNLYNDHNKVSEFPNERWQYIVCLSDEYQHVSFVNGIYTNKGGKHVDYITQQIIKKMVIYIHKKKKMEIKQNIIKEQLCIFLNCSIVNPSFDSQTKDYLNTPASKFGSSCEVGDKFIDKLAKLGLMEQACELSNIKDKNNSKKTDGNKNRTIRGIPKLVDANYAGTNKSNKCILILCEGDSAKSGILSGLTADDRNYYGVYPMKGKMLNVRGENIKKINDNKEIIEIKKILGLESNKVYNDISDLRYNKVLFMTDQDLDGSHIKGLCINMFDCLWSSLLKIEGFLSFMNTPILKVTKGKQSIPFYNENDYIEWKNDKEDKGWKTKYYKGLGTSTGKEFKEYFEDKKIMNIDIVDGDIKSLDLIFNKKNTTYRKNWLINYNKKNTLNILDKSVSIQNFLDKELIHFSKYDCERSIPNIMDGLKISQRKILYSTFKKNLISEIKVAQLSGYVSEVSGYHHGENSLNGAIINMAQDFVGSNNISLLTPNGQFGTRLQGGKDNASERYIYTNLNKITRYIFKKDDDYIINYLNDDGLSVEPSFYIPIIPMILVNGCKGIGTGFSTEIPCFNPLDIIQYIKCKLNNIIPKIIFKPYYNGFTGHIEEISKNKYKTYGKYTKKIKKKIVVNELPIGTWNEDYIIFLDKNNDIISSYKDLSTDKLVHFEITLKNDIDDSQIIDVLKLSSTLNTTNMHLFNNNDKLSKYDSIENICDEFIDIRLTYYEKRRLYMLQKIENECILLTNKYKYIEELLNESIILNKKKVNDIIQILENKNYKKYDNNYNYLIKMSMDSVCEENVNILKKNYDDKKKQMEYFKNITNKDLWLEDLSLLLNEF
jgi:DNA topoisomerase II